MLSNFALPKSFGWRELHRDVAQLVEYASGGRVVAGSSPVIPTKKKNPERKLWVFN